MTDIRDGLVPLLFIHSKHPLAVHAGCKIIADRHAPMAGVRIDLDPQDKSFGYVRKAEIPEDFSAEIKLTKRSCEDRYRYYLEQIAQADRKKGIGWAKQVALLALGEGEAV